MRLSISNIAWDEQYDSEMYGFLSNLGFEGIEIAPTRIFGATPYGRLKEAEIYKEKLYKDFNLRIASMQSIIYGISHKVFGTDEEQKKLIDYLQRAIDFAAVLECGNLVFGSPKNRNLPEGYRIEDGVGFFSSLGTYALEKNTVISIEPNPAIYNTNFINTTSQAFKFVSNIKSQGLKVNLDFGTVIENKESLSVIENNIEYVNHIHISEPYLEKIQEREKHEELFGLLKKFKYDKFVSIEMKKQDIKVVKDVCTYLTSIS